MCHCLALVAYHFLLHPVADEGILAGAFHLKFNARDTSDLTRDPEVDIASHLVSGLVKWLVKDNLDVPKVRLAVFVFE